MKFKVTLTSSQRMALMSLLVEHISRKDATEQFVDWSQSPPVETTPTDLLEAVTNAEPRWETS